jgi:peptide/nickel transport system substrate-binding protein
LVNMGVKVTCKANEPAPTCTGKPDGLTATTPSTAEPLVRQAIAAAIDPKVINDRGYSGAAAVSSQLFQSDFRWYPNVDGPKYDVAKAKDLVTQAKAKGWDGKINVVYNNSPAGSAIGTTFQTMLQSVGMTVALDTNIDIQGQIQKVIIAKNFDITGWGLAIPPDDGAVWALAQNLRSDSSSNRVGYSNPAVDKALTDLLTAKTDADKKALYTTIAQNIATDVPILPWAKIEEFIGHGANVHGLKQVGRSGTLFDKAWLG